eukprot:g8187.t1
MENEVHAEETVGLEDGREAGPSLRWAQLEGESARDRRLDVVACWCRRVAGLIVWCFVAFIFSQLWTVAAQMRNLKLLGVCMLVTASLFYVFFKRYQQIRDSGLSGVELVRALTVDDAGATRLRGVSRKARALFMDFKYDPEGAFRERSRGCGFEPYPPTPTTPDSSRRASAVDGEEETKEGEGEEDEEDRKGPNSWRRRRVRWPWGPRAGAGGGGDGTSSGQGGAAATEADEATPVARGEGDDAGAEQPARARPSAPPPPDLEAGGGGGERGQVIRASELSLSCSVCLFEYHKDEAVTLLPCSHLYHTECIDIWMRDHTNCPHCRADMNSWSTTGGGGGGGGGANRASLGAATAGAGGGSGANSTPARRNAAAAASAPVPATAAAGGVPS